MPSNTKKKTLGNKMTRCLESYKADLIFGATRGRCLTAKHFLLATGLHNVTGSGTAIDKLAKRETAQVVRSQKVANHETILPIKPRDETCIGVGTFFNFIGVGTIKF